MEIAQSFMNIIDSIKRNDVQLPFGNRINNETEYISLSSNGKYHWDQFKIEDDLLFVYSNYNRWEISYYNKPSYFEYLENIKFLKING